MLADSDAERLAAIETGLAAPCDGETRGILLINKALMLHRQGEMGVAVELLARTALDPLSTLATEMLAKAVLWNLLGGEEAAT